MKFRSAEYLGTFPSGSPEWHALRATGLGGSEIAAVLGLSPFESRFSLWHRKRGEAAPQPENDEMRAGKYFEAGIAAWFRDTHPDYRVRRVGTYRSKARPWQIANPDRIITGPDRGREVLEIKNLRTADGWGEPGTDEVPVYYRAQVLWYLDVLGLDRGRFAIAVGGQDLREYVVDYDQAEASILRERGAEFLHDIVRGQRPSIDEHGETYRVIRESHPDIDDVEVEIPRSLAWHFRTAIEAHKRAEADKRRAAAEIADALGDARRAVCDGESIAIRKPGRNGGAPSVTASPTKPAPTRIEEA